MAEATPWGQRYLGINRPTTPPVTLFFGNPPTNANENDRVFDQKVEFSKG